MQALRHLIELSMLGGILLMSVFINAVIFRSIWNAVMPELFGVKPLTRKQAWSLLLMVVHLVLSAYVAVLLVKRMLKLPWT